MVNFTKREWFKGDLDFGATELNRIEAGIEEAINLASAPVDLTTLEIPKTLPEDFEECSATSIKEVNIYINKLVKALKG